MSEKPRRGGVAFLLTRIGSAAACVYHHVGYGSLKHPDTSTVTNGRTFSLCHAPFHDVSLGRNPDEPPPGTPDGKWAQSTGTVNRDSQA